MARERAVAHGDPRRVVYPKARFELLEAKRARAKDVLALLPGDARVFGSVARGDVKAASDIDIEVPFGTASFLVEVALARHEQPWTSRALVKATPNAVVKALWLFGETTVALPLTAPSPLEEGFSAFGGAVDLRGLLEGRRVPGVDKRLMLIEPTPEGHLESAVSDRVDEAARLLGVDREVILGRVRVLRRRTQTGRTGTYLTHTLADDESPEEALDRLKDADPAVRRAASG